MVKDVEIAKRRRARALLNFVKLAGLGGVVFVLAYLCIDLPKHAGFVTPIWLANGVVLASLLCNSKRRWPTIVAVGSLGLLLANFAAHFSLGRALGLAACNAAEFTAAGLALARLRRRPFEMWRAKDCFHFGFVTLACAVGSGMMAQLVIWPGGQAPNIPDMMLWAMSDALGLLIVTPCLLVLARSRKVLAELRRDAVIPFGVLTVAALLSFAQDRYPIQFLPAFGLLFVAWRHRTVGAALGLLVLGAIAVPLTMAGLGPFAYTGNRLEHPILALQTYLAICFFVGVPVAAQSDRVRRLHHDLRRALGQSRDTEARYRLLADNANDLIMTTGVDRLLSYVSPSVLTITGYTQEEVIGQSPLLFLNLEDAARISAAFDEQISGAITDARRLEYRIRAKDGREIWLESRPRTLIDPATGAVLGVSDAARDITVRKAMECELRRAREEAEAGARAKSDFLANMSHELRTPLTSVVGYTRLAAEQPELSSLTRDYVERVGDASRALLCVVNDILDFSKLEAGQVTLTREPTSPVRLARTTLELFQPQAGAKDLHLVLETTLSEDLLLDLDPDRFRQILLNLVGNAVKFTPAGQVTLSVGFSAGRLTVAVRDTGPGIAKPLQAMLFQRFSQVDGSLTRAHGGTGLGLAICKGLVEAMDGVIGVKSTPGKGAIFQFRIPAKVSDAAAPLVEGAAETIAAPGLRVLVVDDHAANRELATLFLAGVGAEVFEAGDGREAVEMAARWPFDVILMDLRMPGMDGPSALAQIRATDGPNDITPVLAFTADADTETAGRLTSLGFDGVVAKPVEPAALIGAVVKACAYTAPAVMETLAEASHV